MSRILQFRLPDLGEGLTEGEILQWLVRPGDSVALNQPIVEVETAKAAVEIPSPYAGVVAELFHAAGETVAVGSAIIAVETDLLVGPAPMSSAGTPLLAGIGEPPLPPSLDFDAPAPPTSPTLSAAPAPAEVEPGLIGGPAPGGRTSVLVGYGPKNSTVHRRPRKSAPAEAPLETPDLPILPTIPDPLHSAAKPVRHGGLEMGRAAERAAQAASAPVLAKPPVRKLAKDLGVDLAAVRGTGDAGTITREDVQRVAQRVSSARSPAVATPMSAPMSGTGGREDRRPVRGVRKLTAEAMVSSAFTAPHVTEFVTVDVTRTMKLVRRLRAELPGVRVTPLLLVARALLAAVRRNPEINASWDSGDIVVKRYVNLGIAAATPRGLIVPNVKDAESLSLVDLARALESLVSVAKDGRTPPADLSGGTITITNVGVFGVDAGTPILNPGEAAILAFGAVRERPWVHKGTVRPRQVTQLSLSFDHRLVDGELGSAVLIDVANVLERPDLLLAWA
ncbi:MAG TPA: 2-oxo acid dehydrogenase subunit E2 [Mycobacteriales bacterium]|nr:2-oxo acid dehydrogenase subunit E2 [Mycobacteriales bacterium]